MNEDFKKGGEDCPQLLNLILTERDWMVKGEKGGGNGFGDAEEKKLELRLGPPGEDWPQVKERREDHNSVLSFSYFPNVFKSTNTAGMKRGFSVAVDSKTEVFQQQQQQPRFLHLQTKAELGRELTQQKTNGRGEQQQSLERKTYCPPPSHASGNAAVVQSSSQTRVVSAPVVGWPPIRSFRKNLASTSSRPTLESHNGGLQTAAKLKNSRKGLFVKINMDGIPIGRKVDLKAYNSYEELCLAVDELFRDLLAAQKDPIAAGTQKHVEKKQEITGLLDGSGEYTLVYEDDEGDQMLVGDVPWEMFVSTAKRLRVLKSSELSTLSLGAINRKRTATEC